MNKVLEIIIYLLEGVKNGGTLLDNNDVKNEKTLYKCNYLLNQTIRQYKINPNNIFVSKNAANIWDDISYESITDYQYRDIVFVDNDSKTEIEKYKGGESTPYEKSVLKSGTNFTYNDIFTDEHIVPVNIIINELLHLDVVNYETVEEVLNKIYICKMLKTEDRSIKNKIMRSNNYQEVIETDYKEAGIEVMTYKEYLTNKIDLLNFQCEQLRQNEAN